MSTFIPPAHRGLVVQKILPLLPAEVLQDIAAFVQALSRSPQPSDFMDDLQSLLQRPSLRHWVSH